MKELIEIWRQQMVLCLNIRKLLTRQQEVLTSLDSVLLNQITAELEPLLGRLDNLQRQQEIFLSAHKAKDAAAFLKEQPVSPERILSEKLIKKIQAEIKAIRSQHDASQRLLQNNMDFIDYNINVMTQVSAGTVYAPDSSGMTPTGSRTKMFDHSV